jgi:hypothetical protein
MLNITVDIKDGASPFLASYIDTIQDTSDLNELGGRAASQAAKDFHSEFGKAGGWRGRNFLGNGANKPGEFGQNIAMGWNFESSNQDDATISNNADYYAFKVRGGTIIPKRNSHLTIPMIADAVGRRAADYVYYSGNILFKVLGKKALFEATPTGVRAVYALVKSVTQKPNPDALPDEDVLKEAFIKHGVED